MTLPIPRAVMKPRMRFLIKVNRVNGMFADMSLSTDRGWFFTYVSHLARRFGSRSEAKRAKARAVEMGYDSARIVEVWKC